MRLLPKPKLFSDQKTECGDSRLWGRPEDVFDSACKFHDYHYQRKHDQAGTEEPVTYARKDIDRGFLDIALRESQGSKYLQCRAYAYYGLIRAVGWLWWNSDKNKTSPDTSTNADKDPRA